MDGEVIEKQRITALDRYQILDTPPDGTFDHLVAIASKVFNVPIAIVSLVDTDRIWFKSAYGLDIRQIDKEKGLCASAILGDDVYIVEDAEKDPRTIANTLVTGSLGLRFYAAIPLKTSDGYNLGTLCIIDNKPRQMSDDQKIILHELAAMVMDEMELRLNARRAHSHHQHMLNEAMHNLRNPLATISLSAELLKESPEETESVREMSDQIVNTAARMNKMIRDLLDTASMGQGQMVITLRKIDIEEVIKRVFHMNKAMAEQKGQKMVWKSSGHTMVMADETKLAEIADNIINNAIKYSPRGGQIVVSVEDKNGKVYFKVEDQGPGFTDEDQKNLFQRFVRLSANPTGGEPSSGLGLSIVKTLVDAHNARIWVQNRGSQSGAEFTVMFSKL